MIPVVPDGAVEVDRETLEHWATEEPWRIVEFARGLGLWVGKASDPPTALLSRLLSYATGFTDVAEPPRRD